MAERPKNLDRKKKKKTLGLETNRVLVILEKANIGSMVEAETKFSMELEAVVYRWELTNYHPQTVSTLPAT